MNKRALIHSGILIFALLGILNAGYLAVTALSGNLPTCNFIHGCDLVAQSPYSYFLGVPLSLYGVFFYSLIAGFALWGLFNKTINVRMFVIPLTTLGFLLSLYFLYLQAFIINAYCEYCLFSLFDAAVLFSLGFFLPKTEHGILNKTQNI